MQIEILNMEKKPSKRRLAVVSIKYFSLVIMCDLVYHPKHKTAWIRMPERWLTREIKERFCYWDDKAISDDFQKEVLNKIFDKYSLDLDTVTSWHVEACEKRAKKII